MAATQDNVEKVLAVLATAPRDDAGFSFLTNEQLAQATGLSPAEINDALALLVESGYAEWRQYLGTAPYLFYIQV